MCVCVCVCVCVCDGRVELFEHAVSPRLANSDIWSEMCGRSEPIFTVVCDLRCASQD